MKNIKFYLTVILLSFMLTETASAQLKLPGRWSLLVFGNFNMNFGISEAMNGSSEEFRNDLETNQTYSKFPFGDGHTDNMCFGAQLAYRFPESSYSLYLNASNTYFILDKSQFSNGLSEMADLMVLSLTAGGEYTFGTFDELWNTFVRAGLNFSLIGGGIEYEDGKMDTDLALRFGFEMELGGRINIPSTPLSLELSTNYKNANLIGKSEGSKVGLLSGLFGVELDDKNKIIDYLSLRLGLRLWF